jgi:hypothetical protein
MRFANEVCGGFAGIGGFVAGPRETPHVSSAHIHMIFRVKISFDAHSHVKTDKTFFLALIGAQAIEI